jgi:hypothetical protein
MESDDEDGRKLSDDNILFSAKNNNLTTLGSRNNNITTYG